MESSRTVFPTSDPRRVRTVEGAELTPPSDWVLLPPGDAGLTRRVKAAGPSWTVVERKGRKVFSHGVWAPAAHVTRAREALELERGSEQYARRREGEVRRRATAHSHYVEDFGREVLAFLRFAPRFATQARALAAAVTAHATPVGSGTVARTARIPVAERAEAAVLAWMRHQTTGYDSMAIARIKGERRAVRRELAARSRVLLDAHRRDAPHDRCALCDALKGAAPRVGPHSESE